MTTATLADAPKISSDIDLFVTPLKNGEARLELHVPAIHCAGCIRKIENAVKALPGITFARVNFTTRRLTTQWQTHNLQAQDILNKVQDIGFEARPFAASDAAAGEPDPASKQLLKAMAVAGFAAMNVMLLSVSVWSGADGATRDLFHLISAGIAIPAVAYSGMPFFKSAWSALRQGRTNMDVPISIGVLMATAMSLFETFNSGPHAYFDGATSLLFFLLVGRYLDSIMRDRARAGVASLLKQSARGAQIRHPNGITEYRPIESVAPGMTVLVATGERIPVDGEIIEGTSAIDMSLVTGESLPETVSIGHQVLAGTMNLQGPLSIKATKVGQSSFLADVVRLMENAEQGRARYTRLADRAARWYAPFVHLTALISFIAWMMAGSGWHQAMIVATAVLIITCPCALGLAVPAVQVRAASVLMRQGLLIKDGSALERLAEIDTVILDKTGTITMGRPLPSGDMPLSRLEVELAAGLASKSSHPLSRALLASAKAQNITPAQIDDVQEHPGLGLQGTYQGETVRLGRPDWLNAIGSTNQATHLELAFQRGENQAQCISFVDPLRPDAIAAIQRLQQMGLNIHILSGDKPQTVNAVAKQLGISFFQARLSPADKLETIQRLMSEGKKLLVVGDGLNDAPMLAAGHASMAPSSASDVGQTAADMLFLNDSLLAIPTAYETALAANKQVKQNFVMAIGYNVFAIPIAMLGLVTPLVAALAMSISSILVVGNALRLKTPNYKKALS